MPKFDITVYTRVLMFLNVEADSSEEALKIAMDDDHALFEPCEDIGMDNADWRSANVHPADIEV